MTLGLGRGKGRRFGSGWISGTLSVTLGALGYGGVLCLLFPDLLTTPDARPLYPLGLIRALIYAFLVAGFGLGLLSALLRRRKTLGLTGIALTVAGTLLGGSSAEIGGPGTGTRSLGLDWFLLNFLVLTVVFVPLERIFPRRPEQEIFRAGWDTDLAHFAVSHLLVQLTVLLTMAPAAVLFGWAVRRSLQASVTAQPAMDWLAGSRLHLFDIVVTRGLSFVPLYVLGFESGAVYAYLVFVSFHPVFIHANVRFRFRALDWILVTPRFHHWHHAAHVEAVNRNFAVHLPMIDRVFGTAYLPDGRWPDVYGIAGNPVPEGYLSQLVYPLQRAKA